LKVASLFSGGKDSTFALWYALHQGWDVVCLVSVRPENPYSWMFHYPTIQWTNLQAEALRIPLIEVKTKGEKETELEDLKSGLLSVKENYKIEGLVTGGVSSEYQRTRFDRICDAVEIRSFTPLWHKNPEILLNDYINFGFDIRITGVFAYGFDETWLGRKLDENCLKELEALRRKYKIHLSGEGGEFQTFVCNGPIFAKRIVFCEVEKCWDGSSGFLIVKDAKLQDKF